MSTNTKLSVEERVAAKKAREAMLIANIDAAIGMSPKLSHPPVFKDEDSMLDWQAVVKLLCLRQRCRLSAEVAYNKRLHLASKRNLG